MAAHTALGALMLGRIGGYMDGVKSRIVTPLTTKVRDYVDPWNLSDISHGAQSEQALFYVYESNIRGLSLPELSSINSALIQKLADGAFPLMDDHTKSYTSSCWIPYCTSYAELLKWNSGIKNTQLDAAANYPNTINAYVTLAHAAYGYAIRTDG